MSLFRVNAPVKKLKGRTDELSGRDLRTEGLVTKTFALNAG